MLPLRAVAEDIGFKVTWNGVDRSILLDNGTVKTTLYIGEDRYFKASSQAIGLTQNFHLGAAPTFIEKSETTFSPRKRTLCASRRSRLPAHSTHFS